MNALVSSELTRQQQDILKVLKFAQRAWRHAQAWFPKVLRPRLPVVGVLIWPQGKKIGQAFTVKERGACR